MKDETLIRIDMIKQKCPTCGAPTEMKWSGLELVEQSGDETLASKFYKFLPGIDWVWIYHDGKINLPESGRKVLFVPTNGNEMFSGLFFPRHKTDLTSAPTFLGTFRGFTEGLVFIGFNVWNDMKLEVDCWSYFPSKS